MSTESNAHLLDRHYSTIGMGDVFVTNPPHELPSSYLSSQQLSDYTIESWEIVGTIKSVAEDFVVREIACDEKKRSDGARVADLEPLSSISTTEKSEVTNKKDRELQQIVNSSDRKRLNATDERSLHQILSEESFQKSASETIEELNNLNQMAIDLLSGTMGDCDKLVEIVIESESASDVSSASLRSALHKTIRREYPLFQTDTKPIGPDGSRCVHVSICTRFFGLKAYLHSPQDELLKLYRFYSRGYEASIKENEEDRVLLCLRQDLPRSNRRAVHEAIHKGSNNMLQTSTIPDYNINSISSGEPVTFVVIVVQWSKQMARKRKRNQDSKPDTNLIFVVRKRNKEHLATVQTLARALRCRQSDIGVAGIKDMRAITYQFFTVSNVASQRLLNAAAFLAKNGIDIGPPSEVPWRLDKGDLQGNHFKITIRELRRVCVSNKQEEMKPLSVTHFMKMLDRVRQGGFVNFFGEQRVGAPGTTAITGVRSFDIGRAILQCNFTKAIDLLMTGRLVTRGVDVECDEIVRFRQEWKNNKWDLDKCWKAMPKGAKMLREQTVLQGLKRYGIDKPIEALRCLHRNERIFWVSSYQAYVWNISATERLKLYGNKVVMGDLVDVDGHVRLVNDEELDVFNIQDVVLPLVGTGILLPKNAVGSMYQDILNNDGICFSNDAPSEALPKGGYRQLVASCQDLEFEIKEKDANEMIRVATVSFSLPKGCYATSLLRELMLTTVGRTFITPERECT